MCSLASHNVDEIGGSSRLGLGKNLGPLHHYFNPFLVVVGKMSLFFGVFSHFGALIRAPGLTDVWYGLPRCG